MSTINPADITQAAHILREGGLVAFPTETVYGLGANAASEAAVRKIFAAKNRPFDHPLIVHIPNLEMLSDWALYISPQALALAQAFWPGPLTMILEKQPWILDSVTGGQSTVGVRIPKHPIAQALLQEFGAGIAAPSANQFTHISPTTAQAVEEELSGKVDMILDGGPCEVGLESTIIDMSGDEPRILRPGMITAQAISTVLGVPVHSRRQDTPVTRAPGMHHLHYAPTTKTMMVRTEDICGCLQALSKEELPAALLLHTQHVHDIPTLRDANGVEMLLKMNLSEDPASYAHDIYHTLRTLDRQQLKRILIEAVPEGAEWEAIRDRLKRACGSLLPE